MAHQQMARCASCAELTEPVPPIPLHIAFKVRIDTRCVVYLNK